MSNDDLRWSPPDGTQPLPSGESGDEAAGHMGFVPLPDLAPLPDIEELLRFAPPTSDDEAVAGQAETDAETSTHAYETFTPQFVWDDDLLFFRDLVIDKATGTITQAPWGEAYPMGVSEGIVVTYLTDGHCTGWSQDSGGWTEVWKATTVKQSFFGLGHMDYTAPDSALIGTSKTGVTAFVPASS